VLHGRRQHLINVFLWPTTQGRAMCPNARDRQGYHLRHWTTPDYTYWVASDLNLAELQDFVRLLQQADSEEPSRHRVRSTTTGAPESDRNSRVRNGATVVVIRVKRTTAAEYADGASRRALTTLWNCGIGSDSTDIIRTPPALERWYSSLTQIDPIPPESLQSPNCEAKISVFAAARAPSTCQRS
jgi:hypothetical protein